MGTWEPGNEISVYHSRSSSLTGNTATWAHGAPNASPLQPQASPDHLWYLLFNRSALLSAEGDGAGEVEVFIRAGGRVLLLHSKAVGESRRRGENCTLTGLCTACTTPVPTLPHPQLSWMPGVWRNKARCLVTVVGITLPNRRVSLYVQCTCTLWTILLRCHIVGLACMKVLPKGCCKTMGLYREVQASITQPLHRRSILVLNFFTNNAALGVEVACKTRLLLKVSRSAM